jgi:hypothetical protein
MLVFLCFAALGTTCNCEKKYAENSSCPNSLRKDYQKFGMKKKVIFLRSFGMKSTIA